MKANNSKLFELTQIKNNDHINEKRCLPSLNISKNHSTLLTNQWNNEINNKCLIYAEEHKGKEINYRLDFNSPRTKDAVEQLGICFEDCIMK